MKTCLQFVFCSWHQVYLWEIVAASKYQLILGWLRCTDKDIIIYFINMDLFIYIILRCTAFVEYEMKFYLWPLKHSKTRLNFPSPTMKTSQNVPSVLSNSNKLRVPLTGHPELSVNWRCWRNPFLTVAKTENNNQTNIQFNPTQEHENYLYYLHKSESF